MKRILFVVTFIGLFIPVYKESEKRGLGRVFNSIKFSIILAAICSGIIPAVNKLPKPSDLIMRNQSTSSKIEKAVHSQYSTSTPEVKYLDHRNIPTYSSRTLILMSDIRTVNSYPYVFPPVTSRMMQIRGGEWKFGPGSKARGAAARNAGKSGGVFVEGFTPTNPYGHQHRYPTRVPHSAQPNPFQPGNGGGNNYGGNGSNFKGGPSPYKDKFNYDNSNHTRENVKFTDRRVDHAYDGHAKKCYGMEGNRNKQNKQEFVKRTQNHIQSPETKQINGSYRYADPAYHYIQDDLIVTVNATNNEFISVRNATKSQLEKLEIDGNLGLDTRPLMVLRLRGPNSTCY